MTRGNQRSHRARAGRGQPLRERLKLVCIAADQNNVCAVGHQFAADATTASACRTQDPNFCHDFTVHYVSYVCQPGSPARHFPGRRDRLGDRVGAAHRRLRVGIDPAPDSGELRRDLRLLQELQLAFFNDPVVQAGLAGVLSDIRADPALGALVYERFMAPRRRSVAAMLTRAADRGETAPIDDPARVSDILTGPLLLRALIPTIGPIDNSLIQATITAALALE